MDWVFGVGAILFIFMLVAFWVVTDSELCESHMNRIIQLYDEGRPTGSFIRLIADQHGAHHARHVVMMVMDQRPDIDVDYRLQ